VGLGAALDRGVASEDGDQCGHVVASHLPADLPGVADQRLGGSRAAVIGMHLEIAEIHHLALYA
jgi:hypothetical protein